MWTYPQYALAVTATPTPTPTPTVPSGFFVQTATAQQNGGSVTLTLPAAPTAGNVLYLLAAGSNDTQSVPTGFTQLAANTGDATYNATWLFSRTVASGDPATWAVTAGGIRMWMLAEALAGTTATVAHGSCTLSGLSASTGTLAAYSGAYPAYRVLAWEFDGRGGSCVPTGAGYTVAATYGAPGFTDASYGVHGAYYTGASASLSGVQTISLTNSPGVAVWMDTVFVYP